MEILYTIAIVLLILNLIGDSVLSHYHSQHAKLLEQQNVLLWALHQESNLIMKELIKENLKKDGGKTND